MVLISKIRAVIGQKQRSGIVRHACQVLGVASVIVVSLGQVPAASSDSFRETDSADPPQLPNLCDWQRDYAFFTVPEEPIRADSTPCEMAFSKRPALLPVSNESAVPPASAAGDSGGFEAELLEIVAGYPIESMVSTIALYDRDIAGLIVGIAKKESNWGKRVPRTESGEDCFNYWGYKGAGARGVAMGHGCFGTSEEAVQAIGKRLQELVALRKTSEPKNMTIWKCGSSCATHSPESVRKWIADVDIYFRAIARK